MSTQSRDFRRTLQISSANLIRPRQHTCLLHRFEAQPAVSRPICPSSSDWNRALLTSIVSAQTAFCFSNGALSAVSVLHVLSHSFPRHSLKTVQSSVRGVLPPDISEWSNIVPFLPIQVPQPRAPTQDTQWRPLHFLTNRTSTTMTHASRSHLPT